MIKVFSVKQTRQIEGYLIKEKQIDEFNLMLEAGRSVFETFKKNLTDQKQEIIVLCGAGNNGGDGYIFANFAVQNGYKVKLFEIGDFKKQSDVAKKAKDLALKSNVEIKPYDDDLIFNKNQIIIDAILGIGIKGKVREEQAKIIEKINNSKAFIISVDNPSGIDCDTGEVLGVAVKANITVTFLSHKQGLFLHYGNQYSGQIEFSDLKQDYSNFINQLKPQYHILEISDSNKVIPKRKIDSHKGDFGHVLIVGGDNGMGGAVIMAAMAACRAGAGRVTVLTRTENVSPLISRLPNVMTAIYESKDDLNKIIKDKSLIAIGPGLGKSDWSKELFEFFMNSNLPKVIDADALNLLSESNKKYNLKNAVITPHPKEAARLLNITVNEIQNNRELAIKKLQEKYGSITILKGSNSLILADDKELFLCPFGTPAMAVAGMGDILTGLIAGLATQHISLKEAAILGVYFHALKSEEIVDKNGEIGLLPMDLIMLESLSR